MVVCDLCGQEVGTHLKRHRASWGCLVASLSRDGMLRADGPNFRRTLRRRVNASFAIYLHNNVEACNHEKGTQCSIVPFDVAKKTPSDIKDIGRELKKAARKAGIKIPLAAPSGKRSRTESGCYVKIQTVVF